MGEKVAIVYTSYAAPPEEFGLNVVYQCGQDEKGTYIVIDEEKSYYSLEVIKNLFTPVNKKWEDVSFSTFQRKYENKKQK